MNKNKFLMSIIVTVVLQCVFLSQARADIDDFQNPGASLSLSDYTFVGENDSDGIGYDVFTAGDVDGDGLDDILIPAPYNDDVSTWSGKVYLILGASLGASSSIDLATADYSFIGEGAYNLSGASVSTAGDVDGDGLDDILIGAVGNSDGANWAGKTYLVLGKSLGSSSTIDLATADYAFVGEGASDYSGHDVSTAGDVDGDGLDDILISAHYNDEGGTHAGKVYLILASSLGSSSTIDLSAADYSFVGESGSDFSGISISTAGDVNGDGLDDILIGAVGNSDGGTNAGKTYLILGASLSSSSTIDLATADYSFIGETSGDASGHSVSTAGDVDGDGLSDILIGAYGNDDGGVSAGKAYIILATSFGSSSTIDLSTADYAFIGEDINDHAGYSVSPAGDVDGDGLDDILIGANMNSASGSNSGKTYIVLGSSLGTDATIDLSAADYTLVGENDAAYSGYSISTAGDVNGDGMADILIGAPYNNDKNIVAGKAYLILGHDSVCNSDDVTDTIYVDEQEGYTSTRAVGSEACPFLTITEGINEAVGLSLTQVNVKGGFYDEVVTLQRGIELKGESRETTLGTSADTYTIWPWVYSSTMPDFVFEGADNASVEGFAILGAGVELDSVSNMTFRGNYIYNNYSSQPSILLDRASNNIIENNIVFQAHQSGDPVILIEQLSDYNIFTNNTLHSVNVKNGFNYDMKGFYIDSSTTDNEFRNNIVSLNPKTTIGQIAYGFYSSSTSPSVTIEYNKTTLNQYNLTLDSTNIQSVKKPGFIDPLPDGTDYQLNTSSICIDAGDPDSSYDDVDGSTNDMGAYGGANPIEVSL
jgi:hypothetical protein